ncbi:MFS transporter [Actinoplanes couchii]|uniref:MFS transporter n=1 Tax=Actinoplanes couchii TaxID=403638 RepID=A0ABQ3XB89_9ACTN|nr:MFS transporter [Actinoplanes couchii]
MLADRRPLAVPAFRRWWTASLVTAIGGSFSVVAVPAQLYTATGTSAAVGGAAVLTFAGLTAGALGGGVLADRHDRRRVLLAGQSVLAATCTGLWAQAAFGGALPYLLVLVLFQGLAFGVISTATGAVLPRLVPSELLAAANGLNSLVRYGGSILGPVLAGLLLPLTGVANLYLFDAVALTAVLWAVFRLPPLYPERRTDRPAQRVRVSRLVLAVLAVDLAAMVFGMPIALFPELARHFGDPAGGGLLLGLFYAAYPAGVFLAGFFGGVFTGTAHPGRMMAGAAIAWGVAVVLLGLASIPALALLALVVGGAVNFVLSTHRNAITQAHVDDEMRGRIQGVLTVVLYGGPQLANLLHGTAGALVGPRAAIVAGGLLTVTSVVAVRPALVQRTG